MTGLHPCIRGTGNNFCGPAAIVSAFGVDVSVAAALIRKVSGKTKVFGVSNRHLAMAMKKLGHVDEVKGAAGPLEKLAPTLAAGTYVISFNNHYCTVDTRTMEACDNHTIYPLPLARYRLRRKRVTKAWWIR